VPNVQTAPAPTRALDRSSRRRKPRHLITPGPNCEAAATRIVRQMKEDASNDLLQLAFLFIRLSDLFFCEWGFTCSH